MELHIIILAAGKGTRMKSDLPKVLHPLAGKPLLGHVVDCARSLNPAGIHVVYGHQGPQLRQAFANDELNWIEQPEQLGTGHAVHLALPSIPEPAQVLVLYGDVPLVQPATLNRVLSAARDTLGVVTLTLSDPTGYGRIVRGADGRVQGIVEQKDANPEQQSIREVNTGIMAAPAQRLKSWLPRIGNQNSQGEYYLTDIVGLAVADGLVVETVPAPAAWEVEGVNNRLQLAALERVLQRRRADQLMLDGVTLADPARLDVRGTLKAGTDCEIDVNVVIEGHCELGNRVRIGPHCVLRDAIIGDDTTIEAMSLIDSARLEQGVHVGPFARIRPGTLLKSGSRIGNFVETKKATIGQSSKVNHLSYVGDATVGRDVNIGAGTITCNYDGVNKHQTIIEDGVFVGSNTALVAPVTLHAGATIGAGSTITKTVDAEELAIARAQQRNIRNWKRPSRKA